MPLAKNIASDRGLTIRMFVTGLLLVILYGGFIAILFAQIGLSFGFIVFIAVALLFAQYWFSDRIAMWSMHAHEVTPEQEPELHGIIDRLCALADMPKPRVAIADVDIPDTRLPPVGAPRRRSCVRQQACCGGSMSPRWRPCWPMKSPTSPTATSR